MTYKGHEIFPYIPLVDDQNNIISNPYVLVGKEAKKQTKTILQPTNRQFAWTFSAKTLAEAKAMRAWFRSKYGRLTPFWLRSYKNDVTLTQQSATGSMLLYAKKTQRNFGLYGQKRHLLIPDLSFAAKITSVVFADATVNSDEVLTLDTALSNTVFTQRIEYLYLVRFNSDEFVLEKDGVRFKTTFNFIELQGETP
ncbi:hypothetical protein [Sulfurospirillum cavolei]|uniref:hypothetical protein n=1 Tax=Sulfurospirillum cavolei TaxID=366522 RepID=UPI0005A76858|nr:hypothetical protein [Sulfurospirillum cavolei]